MSEPQWEQVKGIGDHFADIAAELAHLRKSNAALLRAGSRMRDAWQDAYEGETPIGIPMWALEKWDEAAREAEAKP